MSFLGDIIGGFFGNNAADKAADATVKASQASSQTMLDMFNRSNQIQAPFQQAGLNALAMQGSLLGNPNLVPQSAVATSLAATGTPGANTAFTNYGAANPDVLAYYRNNPKALAQFGGSLDRALEHHYNTFGRAEGRGLPSATAPGVPGTVGVGGGAMMPGGSSQPTVQPGGIGVGTGVDQAYNAFLDSGFGRANLTTTGTEFDQMIGSFGAGGTSLSGSALGALNDRNRRNTANAFGQYYGALSGISNTGANINGQQAGAANQVGANVANNQLGAGNARASSYLTQGENNANTARSGVNAFASWFGGR